MKKYVTLVLFLLVSFGVHAQQKTQYTFDKGDEFNVVSSLKQEIEQTIFGQVSKTVQDIATVDKYEVVEVTQDGYRLKVTSISRKLDLETPQGSMSMDSELEGEEHLVFKALSNKTYYLLINNQGKVISLEGLEEMHAAIKGDLEGTTLEASAADVIETVDSKTIITGFEGQFHIYPEQGATVLKKSEEVTVNSLPIFVDITYNWNNPNSITASGNLTMIGNIDIAGTPMDADISGEQTGKYVINLSNGLPTNIEFAQDMSGDLTVQGTAIPMTIKSTGVVSIEQ